MLRSTARKSSPDWHTWGRGQSSPKASSSFLQLLASFGPTAGVDVDARLPQKALQDQLCTDLPQQVDVLRSMLQVSLAASWLGLAGLLSADSLEEPVGIMTP